MHDITQCATKSFLKKCNFLIVRYNLKGPINVTSWKIISLQIKSIPLAVLLSKKNTAFMRFREYNQKYYNQQEIL